MNQYSPIPLLVPKLPDLKALSPYLERIDLSKQYSNFGPLVKSLEGRLEKMFQDHTTHTMHVTTISSATSGLELALYALGLAKGSRVLVPALTFVATLTAVIRAGFLPVVTDIDYDSWLLTPEIADAAIKKSGAKAALVVATFGQPQDTLGWSEFQKKMGVRIIVDAAGAFGSQWVNASDVPVVYSMHATKSLAAGEGGFVVSGDMQFNRLIAQLSNFGIVMNLDEGQPIGYLSHVGTNAKLSEYHAAVAHASLDGWTHAAKGRSAMYSQYRQKLIDACGSALIWQSGISLPAPNTLSVRLGSVKARESVEKLCSERRISTRRWYQPLLHHHSSRIKPMEILSCPVAESVAADLIGLPFSIFLLHDHLERIITAVKDGITN